MKKPALLKLTRRKKLFKEVIALIEKSDLPKHTFNYGKIKWRGFKFRRRERNWGEYPVQRIESLEI